MDSLLQDLRYAIRSLSRSRAFTIAAVLTLALGIGANTVIFSVVDGVLLRRAPVADVDRLMVIWETDRKGGTTNEPASLPDLIDFQQRSRTVRQFGAFVTAELNLTHERTDARRLAALGVTAEFLPMLGIAPVAGRLLEESETVPGGPRAALISTELAQQLFVRAEDAVGKTIRLNDVDWSVAGVLPSQADFGMLQILGAADYGKGFAQRGGRTRVDVWVGLRANVASLPRSTHPIIVVGRLADGSTPAAAQEELAGIMAELERTYPENEQRGANVQPLGDVVFGPVRPALITLLAAVALVLLVACANVANLLLVRAGARVREVTVRVALGAGVRRLAQQFFIEGAVLAFAGAALGMLLAFTGLDVVRALAPATLPRVDAVAIDLRVLGVTMALTVLVAIAFGALPTLHARRTQLHATLQGSAGRSGSAGREHRRFRNSLIVSEIAMATMLMVGAGLLIRSLWRLQQVDPGFAASGVLKAEYQLPASRYPRISANYPNWVEAHRFSALLRTRIAAIPDVESVVVASYHPLDAGSQSSIRVVGREAEGADWPEPSVRMVGATYFETMKVAVAAGRGFADTDDGVAPPVAVINEAARKRFFDGSDPIGHQIALWGANRTIVGVVADERFQGVPRQTPPGVYVPVAQVPPFGGNYSVLVRARGNPEHLAGALRGIVRDIDPQLALFGVEPLTVTMANSMGQQRFTMAILGAFAAVALLLAAIGVHGVLSYTVAQRTGEIGIRMALGANQRRVRALVLEQGAVLAAVGLAIGLVVAFALSSQLSTLLYGVGPRDPLTFAVVGLALAAVAMFAAYLPARRAASVDPMIALRTE